MPNMLATASNGNSKPLSEELSDIIQRHLCSVQWEIRDTTLEFLGQVMEKYGGKVLLMVIFVAPASALHDRGVQLLLFAAEQIGDDSNEYPQHMSHAMRKPDLCHMQTTKVQISLRICAV